MLEAPVLALPDFAEPFTVETDACKRGVGAVLAQKGHPIAYLSKALGPTAQTMSTYEKECLAILLAVDKWRSYLQRAPFTIITDHRSLVHLSDQNLPAKCNRRHSLNLWVCSTSSRGATRGARRGGRPGSPIADQGTPLHLLLRISEERQRIRV